MGTLPNDLSTDRNEAAMKVDLDAFLSGVKEMPGGQAPEALTISSGSVTPTGCAVIVDTEGAAATDNLDVADVTNHPEGRLLLVRATSSLRVVTIRHNQGGSGQFLTADGNSITLDNERKQVLFCRSGTSWYEVARGGAVIGSRAIFVEEQTSGTDGGTFTAGAWQKRSFNTTRRNDSSIVALATSVFTPTAGTYLVRWSCPARNVNNHQTRLQKTSGGGSTIGYGSTERSPTGASSRSEGTAVVTATGSETFEIQHYSQSSQSTDGFGQGAGFGTEVYSIVEWERLA